MSLWMKVESLAGDRIEEVAADMCVLANRLHVGVQCAFNGVTLNMPVAGCAETLVEEFHSVVGTVHKCKLAFGYRKVSS